MGKMHGMAGGAVVLAAALAWGLHALLAPASPPSDVAAVSSHTSPRQGPPLATAVGAEVSAGGRPVRGMGMDRNLVFRTGASGQLLVDSGAIDRLNALLDMEHSDHDAQVPEQAATLGLDEAHAVQARGVLARLRALRADEKALFTQPGRAEGLEGAAQMLAAQRALRRQHFGAEAEHLFGAEEAQVARQIQALAAVK